MHFTQPSDSAAPLHFRVQARINLRLGFLADSLQKLTTLIMFNNLRNPLGHVRQDESLCEFMSCVELDYETTWLSGKKPKPMAVWSLSGPRLIAPWKAMTRMKDRSCVCARLSHAKR